MLLAPGTHGLFVRRSRRLPGPQVTGDAIGVRGGARARCRSHRTRRGRHCGSVWTCRCPGNAIFGFEHAPATDEERASVRDALVRLEQEAGSLIEFCRSRSLVAWMDLRSLRHRSSMIRGTHVTHEGAADHGRRRPRSQCGSPRRSRYRDGDDEHNHDAACTLRGTGEHWLDLLSVTPERSAAIAPGRSALS